MSNEIAIEEGSPRVSRHALFGQFIGKKVTGLQQRYLNKDPRAHADLARLRRTVGRSVGSDAESWPIVFDQFPQTLMGRGDEPSRWETAAHLALGLFAQHMQSATRPMHVAGLGLGHAIGRLCNPADGDSREKPVMRRFQALGTALSLDETVYHARGLIQQLRAEEISLDYARLARDLVDLQNPQAADSVRLRWARDLYRIEPKATENASSEETQESA